MENFEQAISKSMLLGASMIESHEALDITSLESMMAFRAAYKMMEQDFLRHVKDLDLLNELNEVIDKIIWQMAEDREEEKDETFKPRILDAFGLEMPNEN